MLDLDLGMIIVLVMRLLGPLMIFKWPLLGSLLSEFVFDVADVPIWATLGTSDINYTFYDKPLDMYQFTIQAIVASRWEHPGVRNTALMLYGYRLLGYVLYFFTEVRALFFFFPNVFSFFFIGYLIAKKAEMPELFEERKKMSIVLLILFLLKLPQEFILHWQHGWVERQSAVTLLPSDFAVPKKWLTPAVFSCCFQIL